jgi:hypothetical protein
MSQAPDAVVMVTPFGEIQERMGIPSIEALLAERDTLVRQVASLRAVHGSFGTYDAYRKIELASIAQIIRAEAAGKGTKVTEAFIEEAAHASGRYLDFVTKATQEKAQLAELENRIQGINDTVNRGQAVAKYLAAEVSLAR